MKTFSTIFRRSKLVQNLSTIFRQTFDNFSTTFRQSKNRTSVRPYKAPRRSVKISGNQNPNFLKPPPEPKIPAAISRRGWVSKNSKLFFWSRDSLFRNIYDEVIVLETMHLLRHWNVNSLVCWHTIALGILHPCGSVHVRIVNVEQVLVTVHDTTT